MKTQTNGPIYLRVQELLQGLLDSKELEPGSQIPSERTLMAQFETSNMPVRQAIQHFIDKGIFERVHGRGTFVKKQDAQKTQRIAVLYVYDNAGMWASPFYTEIIRGIENVSIDYDKRLILESVGSNDIYTVLSKIEDEVDGFLIMDLFPSMVERVEKYVRERRKPVVVINYPHRWSQCSAVLTDNVNNAYKLTEHLINFGHQKIAYLYHRSTMGTLRELSPTNVLKQQGYREALKAHHISYDEALALEISKTNSDAIIAELQKKSVTAVFCSGSSLVSGCLIPAMKRLNLRVAEDLSIVTYDNTRDIKEHGLSISTIDTEISELGNHAARCLFGKINDSLRNDSVIYLPGEIINRNSVKRI